MKALIALALFALCGCAVKPWRPEVGDTYREVCLKLNAGTAAFSVEGCEVRWWLEDPRTAVHWVYYARFDGPPTPDVLVNGETIYAGASRLVEFQWNTHAYPETLVAQP